MSSVDTRVVRMEFDNAQFEQAANNTMSTLAKLEDSLQFSNGAAGIDNVQRSINDLDVSKVETAIDKVNDGFSAMGIAGKRVIEDLTDSIYNFATKTLSNMWNSTIGQIQSGGWGRASNLAQAKFMLKGLDIAWDDVKDSINEAVADTAYGLDEAAKACSQLAVSGTQLGDDMTKALRGISGVAAMTNSEYSDIAGIFTTIAGQGKIMAYQLNQLSFRGLNAAAVLADQLGVTEAEVREMVHSGEIGFKTFADAMDDAFGPHAKAANETFTGAMANVKASLSRIGAEFATPYMENMVPLFNDLRLFFNTLKQAIAEPTSVINQIIGDTIEMASSLVQGARTFLFQFLDDKQLESIGFAKEEIEAFREIVEEPVDFPLLGLFQKIADIVREIKENFFGLREYIPSVFNGKQDLSTFNTELGSLFQSKGITFDENGALQQVDLLDKLTEKGYNFWQIEELINQATKGVSAGFENMSEEQLKEAGYTDRQISALESLKDAANYDFFAKFGEGTLQLEDITKAIDNISEYSGALRDIGGVSDEVKERFNSLINQVRAFNDESFSHTINDLLNGSMENLFGNVQLDTYAIDNWTEDLKNRFRENLKSWDIDPSIDQITSVFGMWDNFSAKGYDSLGGVDLAFTPFMAGLDGSGIVLDKDTVYQYISQLLEEASVGGVLDFDQLMRLDEEGMMIGETFVQGIIAGIDTASKDGGEINVLARLMGYAESIPLLADFFGISAEVDNVTESVNELGQAIHTNQFTGESFLEGLVNFGNDVDKSLGKTVSNVIGDPDKEEAALKKYDELNNELYEATKNVEKLEAAYKFESENLDALTADGEEVTAEMRAKVTAISKNLDDAKDYQKKIQDSIDTIVKGYDLTPEKIVEIRDRMNDATDPSKNQWLQNLKFMQKPDVFFSDRIKDVATTTRDDERGLMKVIRDISKSRPQSEFFTNFFDIEASKLKVGVEYAQTQVDDLNEVINALQDSIDLQGTDGDNPYLTKEEISTFETRIAALTTLRDKFQEILTDITAQRDEFFNKNNLDVKSYKGYSEEELAEFGFLPGGIDAEYFYNLQQEATDANNLLTSDLKTLKERLGDKYDAMEKTIKAELTAQVNALQNDVDLYTQLYDAEKQQAKRDQFEAQKAKQINSVLDRIDALDSQNAQREQQQSNQAYMENLKSNISSLKESMNAYAQAEKEFGNINFNPAYGQQVATLEQWNALLKTAEAGAKNAAESTRQLSYQQNRAALEAQLGEIGAQQYVEETLSSNAQMLNSAKQALSAAQKELSSAHSRLDAQEKAELQTLTDQLQKTLSENSEVISIVSEYNDNFLQTRARLGVPVLGKDITLDKLKEETEEISEKYDEISAQVEELDSKKSKTKEEKAKLAELKQQQEQLYQQWYDLETAQSRQTSIVAEMSEAYRTLYSNAMLNGGEDMVEFYRVLISQLTIGLDSANKELTEVDEKIQELNDKKANYDYEELADINAQIKDAEENGGSQELIDRLKEKRDREAAALFASTDKDIEKLESQRRDLEISVNGINELITAYGQGFKSLSGMDTIDVYNEQALEDKGYVSKDFAAVMELLKEFQNTNELLETPTTTEEVAAYMSVFTSQMKRVIHDQQKRLNQIQKNDEEIEKINKKLSDNNISPEERVKLEADRKKLRDANDALLGEFDSEEALQKAIEANTRRRGEWIDNIHAIGYKAKNYTDEELEALGYSIKEVDADNKGFVEGLEEVDVTMAKYTDGARALRKAINDANKPTKEQVETLKELYKNLDPGDENVSGIVKLGKGILGFASSVKQFFVDAFDGLKSGEVGESINTSLGKIGSFFQNIGDLINGTDGEKIKKVFEGIGKAFAFVVDIIAQAVVILGGFAVLIGGKVFGAIGGLLTKFTDWINKEETINKLTEISDAIFDKFSLVLEKIGTAFDWVKDKVTGLWDAFKKSKTGGAITGFLGDTIDGIFQLLTMRKRLYTHDENGEIVMLDEPKKETNEFLKVYDKAVAKIQEFFGLSSDWKKMDLSEFADGIIPLGRKITDTFDRIKTSVTEWFTAFNEAHPDFIGEVFDKIGDALMKVVDFGASALEFAVQFVSTFTNSEGFKVIKDTIVTLFETITGFGKTIFEAIFGKKEDQSVGEAQAESVANVADKIASKTEQIQKAAESFAEKVSGIITAIRDKFEAVKKLVEDTLGLNFDELGEKFGSFVFGKEGYYNNLMKEKTAESIEAAKQGDLDRANALIQEAREYENLAKEAAENGENKPFNFKALIGYDDNKTLLENVKKWISDFVNFVKTELKALVDWNDDKTLFENIQSIFDRLVAFVKEKFESLKSILGFGNEGSSPSKNPIMAIFDGILGTGGEVGEGLEESEGIIGKIVKFLKDTGDTLGSLGGGVVGMITGALGGVFTKIAEFLQNSDLNTVIKTIRSGIITYAVFAVAKFVSQIGSLLFYFKKKSMWSLNPFNVSNILKIILTLGVFATSLALIGSSKQINFTTFAAGLLKLIPAFAGLIGIFAILGALNKKYNIQGFFTSLRGIGDMFVGIAAGLGLMVLIWKMIEALSPKKTGTDGKTIVDTWALLGPVLAAFIIPFGAFIAAAALVNHFKLGEAFKDLGVGISAFGRAITNFAKAAVILVLIGYIMTLNDNIWEMMLKGGLLVGALMLVGAALIWVANKFGILKVESNDTMTTMEKFAEVLNKFVGVIKIVATLIVGVLIIGALADAIAMLASLGPSVWDAAGSISILAMALAGLFYILEGVSANTYIWGKTLITLLGIVAVAYVLATAINSVIKNIAELRKVWMGTTNTIDRNSTLGNEPDIYVSNKSQPLARQKPTKVSGGKVTRNPDGSFTSEVLPATSNSLAAPMELQTFTYSLDDGNFDNLSDQVYDDYSALGEQGAFGYMDGLSGLNDYTGNMEQYFQNMMNDVGANINYGEMFGGAQDFFGDPSALMSSMLGGNTLDPTTMFSNMFGNMFGTGEGGLFGGFISSLFGGGDFSAMFDNVKAQLSAKLRELAGINPETGEKGPLYWARSLVSALVGDDKDNPEGHKGVLHALGEVKDELLNNFKIDEEKLPGIAKWALNVVRHLTGKADDDQSLVQAIFNTQKEIDGFVGVLELIGVPQSFTDFIKELRDAYDKDGIPGAIDYLTEKIKGLPEFLESTKTEWEKKIKAFFGLDENSSIADAILKLGQDLGGKFVDGIKEKVEDALNKSWYGKAIIDAFTPNSDKVFTYFKDLVDLNKDKASSTEGLAALANQAVLHSSHYNGIYLSAEELDAYYDMIASYMAEQVDPSKSQEANKSDLVIAISNANKRSAVPNIKEFFAGLGFGAQTVEGAELSPEELELIDDSTADTIAKASVDKIQNKTEAYVTAAHPTLVGARSALLPADASLLTEEQADTIAENTTAKVTEKSKKKAKDKGKEVVEEAVAGMEDAGVVNSDAGLISKEQLGVMSNLTAADINEILNEMWINLRDAPDWNEMFSFVPHADVFNPANSYLELIDEDQIHYYIRIGEDISGYIEEGFKNAPKTLSGEPLISNEEVVAMTEETHKTIDEAFAELEEKAKAAATTSKGTVKLTEDSKLISKEDVDNMGLNTEEDIKATLNAMKDKLTADGTLNSAIPVAFKIDLDNPLDSMLTWLDANKEKKIYTIGDAIADNLNKGFTEKEQIGSPSKVWSEFARNIYQGLINGIDVISTGIESKGREIASNINNGFKGGIAVVAESGRAMMTGLTNAINETEMWAVGNSIAIKLLNGLRSQSVMMTMTNSGVYLINGIIEGIHKCEQALIDVGTWAANTVNNAFKSKQQINSPSKVWGDFGHYITSGLINSIYRDKTNLENASLAISDPFENAMWVIKDAAEGDYDFTPNIAPTFDSSYFSTEAGYIDDVFADRSAKLASLSSELQSRNAEELARMKESAVYNDKNVVNAIGSLQEDIVNLNGAIQNIRLYLDTGALVGGIAPGIDRQLGQNKFRRARGI